MKKVFRYLVTSAVLFVLLLTPFQTTKVQADVNIDEISISQVNLTLDKNKTKTLKIKIKPSSLEKSATITWISSNKRVATVNAKGKVTAVGEGSATISAKVKISGIIFTKRCKVTVAKPVTSITLNPTTVTLNVNETVQLKVNINSNTAGSDMVTYSTSDKGVAVVTKAGKITAKGAGKATITVKVNDGNNKKAEMEVTVLAVKADIPTYETNYNYVEINSLFGTDKYYRMISTDVIAEIDNARGIYTDNTYERLFALMGYTSVMIPETMELWKHSYTKNIGYVTPTGNLYLIDAIYIPLIAYNLEDESFKYEFFYKNADLIDYLAVNGNDAVIEFIKQQRELQDARFKAFIKITEPKT